MKIPTKKMTIKKFNNATRMAIKTGRFSTKVITTFNRQNDEPNFTIRPIR